MAEADKTVHRLSWVNKGLFPVAAYPHSGFLDGVLHKRSRDKRAVTVKMVTRRSVANPGEKVVMDVTLEAPLSELGSKVEVTLAHEAAYSGGWRRTWSLT